MAWSAENPDMRFAVDTYVGWDCKRNMRSDRSAQPSPSIMLERKLCFRLPPELVGKDDIRVEGIMDFRLGHSLYTVPVRIPPEREDWPTVTRSIPVAP